MPKIYVIKGSIGRYSDDKEVYLVQAFYSKKMAKMRIIELTKEMEKLMTFEHNLKVKESEKPPNDQLLHNKDFLNDISIIKLDKKAHRLLNNHRSIYYSDRVITYYLESVELINKKEDSILG